MTRSTSPTVPRCFLPLRGGHHGRAHGDDVLVVELLLFGRGLQHTAHPHHREAPDLQVQI
jgi:hypothetical protein